MIAIFKHPRFQEKTKLFCLRCAWSVHAFLLIVALDKSNFFKKEILCSKQVLLESLKIVLPLHLKP